MIELRCRVDRSSGNSNLAVSVCSIKLGPLLHQEERTRRLFLLTEFPCREKMHPMHPFFLVLAMELFFNF